ncbi:MAG TPA: zinc metallopeptidase [Desulfobacteraceae bacterium]|nr:zinc metallopeptidase [Desulfobacteraceae bacterium]
MSEEKGRVGIMAFGSPAAESVRSIAAAVPVHFGMPAEILPPVKTPSYAFDPIRIQYNAIPIIENIEAMEFSRHFKILGILTVDLFLPVFTHVFGEARKGGKCALVSLYRLNRGSGNTSASSASVSERATKVALHELGHLFDTVHCMDRGCLMHFSMDLDQLDQMPLEFCRYCRAFLTQSIRRFNKQADLNRIT